MAQKKTVKKTILPALNLPALGNDVYGNLVAPPKPLPATAQEYGMGQTLGATNYMNQLNQGGQAMFGNGGLAASGVNGTGETSMY